MRVGVSVVAAVSGLFFLGLTYFGQPSVYLRQVREGWVALMVRPAGQPPADPDYGSKRETGALPDPPVSAPPVQPDYHPNEEKLARIQLEISRLKKNLVAKPLVPEVPAAVVAKAVEAPSAAVQTGAVQVPVVREPIVQVPVVGAPVVQVPAVQAPAVHAPAVQGPVVQALVVPEPVVPEPGPAPVVAAASAPKAVPPLDAGIEKPRPVLPRAVVPVHPPAPPVVVSVPERHEAATRHPVIAMVNPLRSQRPKPQLQVVIPPAPQFVAPSPVPSPPPLPPPSAAPEEGEGPRSVLARLRQAGPEPAKKAADVPAPREIRAHPALSLRTLVAARAALARGRIEDARHLLQEAQLQLVFRPAEASGDDLPRAGKGAADVAHALDALSANDVVIGRRYVEVAMGDLSGSRSNVAIPRSDWRASGYAPAYPPH